MHALLIIVAIHCALLGFGFLFAVWTTLASPDKRDIDEINLELEVAKEQGLRGIIGLALDRNFWRWPSPGLVSRNWHNQPGIRKLLVWGCVFLAIAIVASFFLGVFN